MNIREEHKQLKWELEKQHDNMPKKLTVENLAYHSIQARRQLMYKYFRLGRPEELIPLFNYIEEDQWDVTFMFIALASYKKYEQALALWKRCLDRVEKLYWAGLRKFRRLFNNSEGNPAAFDPEGQRVELYEQYRPWLNSAYGMFKNDLLLIPQRFTKGLEKQIDEKLRQINSETMPEIKIQPDSREMTEAVFWELIEQSKSRDSNEHLEQLGNLLCGFEPKQIKRFNQHLRPLLKSASTWDLWGAGYLLQGGCSDDGFLYFRCWLILQGKEKLVAAIKNADSMAKWVTDNEDETYDAEELMYLADEIYEEVTGKDGPEMGIGTGGKVEGKRWKKPIELKERLPKLFRRFPCDDDAE